MVMRMLGYNPQNYNPFIEAIRSHHKFGQDSEIQNLITRIEQALAP